MREAKKKQKSKSDNTASKYWTIEQSLGDLAGDVQKQIPGASLAPETRTQHKSTQQIKLKKQKMKKKIK